MKNFERMVNPERFERPTFWFVVKCSIQLSYGSLPISSEVKQHLKDNALLNGISKFGNHEAKAIYESSIAKPNKQNLLTKK